MDQELLKKRFQKARLPGADFRKQFGKQWTKRDKPFFTMRFSLRLGFAVLILFVVPFIFLHFSKGSFSDQFLAQAAEVYAQNPDFIVYEKIEQLSTFRGTHYHQFMQTWNAPNGSFLWESRDADGQKNEMSGMDLSFTDERGVNYNYTEDYAGDVPTEHPFCRFSKEDDKNRYQVDFEMDGSSEPGFGGFTLPKDLPDQKLNPVDNFFMAFNQGGNSGEQGQKIIETLKGNSDWIFEDKESDAGHFYSFSTEIPTVKVEVVFDAVTSLIAEITVESNGEKNTSRYLEHKLIPLDQYDSIFNPSLYPSLSLAFIGHVQLPETAEEGCYSVDGKRLSDEEAQTLLSTLKEGYIEKSFADMQRP